MRELDSKYENEATYENVEILQVKFQCTYKRNSGRWASGSQ